MSKTQKAEEYTDKAENKNLMTTGSVSRKIISFAIPIFLGNLFQQLYNTADSIIVGNFIGSNALAAVSSAGNLIFLVIGFFNGISIGAGVVIANYIGAKQEKNVESAVHSTVALGLVFSVIMTVAGVLLAPVVLRLMSTPEAVLPESVKYFRVYYAGAAGFVMYNTFVGILQAAGDSRHPLHYLVFSSVVNVILDLVLIAGLGFGVGAAAFATAVSQLASAVLSFIRLVKTKESYRIVPSKIRFDKAMTLKIIRYGFPTGLQNSIMAFSNVVIQSYINSYGELAMAGIGAYSKVEGFGFLPVTSFTMAITTFVSQNLGAGRKDRVKKGIRFGLLCTLICAEAIGICLWTFSPYLVRMFDSNPGVIMYGVQRAHVVGLFFFLCAYTHFIAATMRGAGKPGVPLLVFLVCWCLMRVLILSLFNPVFRSVYITHWVYPITWTLSSVTLTVLYKKMKIAV